MPFPSQSKQAKIIHVCQTLNLMHYCRIVQSSFLQRSGKQWTNVSCSASYSTAHNIRHRKMLIACTECTMVPSDHRKTRIWCLLVVNTTYEWCRKMPTTHTDHKIISWHHSKVTGGWDQLINTEKLVRGTKTIHTTLQFLLLIVSQHYTPQTIVGS